MAIKEFEFVETQNCDFFGEKMILVFPFKYFIALWANFWYNGLNATSIFLFMVYIP